MDGPYHIFPPKKQPASVGVARVEPLWRPPASQILHDNLVFFSHEKPESASFLTEGNAFFCQSESTKVLFFYFWGFSTEMIWKKLAPFSLPWFLEDNSVDLQMWNNKDQTSTKKYQDLQENLLASSKCWLHPKQVELTLSQFGQVQLQYQCLPSTQPA